MAINGQRLAGTVSVTINGIFFDVASDVTYLATSYERKALEGSSGVVGYSETPIAGQIEVNLRTNGGWATTDLYGFEPATVQVQAANGMVILGSGMWLSGTPTVNVVSGSVTATFETTTGGVVEITT